ncbi:MAG TPA: glycosyl hydrolase [Polyangiales bacterium]|nr:glycosyl hydrolase [Polyangiales bacterium]
MRSLAFALCLFAATAHAQPLRDRVLLGAFVNGVPYSDTGVRDLRALERSLGSKLEIASGFVDWEYVLGNERDLALSAGGTRTLLYSWEPHCSAQGCVTLGQVARGEHDAYLLRVAASMKRFPHDLYVRPWGEMNAEWSAWQPDSGRNRAGTREEFIAAWRHVHTLFREQGVHNLKFVFNPDASDDGTPVPSIWPGAEYVDVLGIDGYNWGDGKGDSWTSFEDIFARMYGVLTALHPTAPVWICELGSKEPRANDGSATRPAPVDPKHDKGAWIDAMMQSPAFPRLTALVFFNVRKERDFRLESSPESLRAIRKQLRLRVGTRVRSPS